MHQTLLEFVNVVHPWLISHSLWVDTPYLGSQLDWGRDCLAATDPVEWKQVLLAWEVAQCHMPDVQEHCPVERWRTHLTRHASLATAAVTGAHHSSRRRSPLLLDQRRSGLWCPASTRQLKPWQTGWTSFAWPADAQQQLASFSQGSVATHLRCGELFNNHFTTNFLKNRQWKNFENRLRFDRVAAISLVLPFLRHSV